MNIVRTFCNESVNGGARAVLTMLKFIFSILFYKKIYKKSKGEEGISPLSLRLRRSLPLHHIRSTEPS